LARDPLEENVPKPFVINWLISSVVFTADWALWRLGVTRRLVVCSDQESRYVMLSHIQHYICLEMCGLFAKCNFTVIVAGQLNQGTADSLWGSADHSVLVRSMYCSVGYIEILLKVRTVRIYSIISLSAHFLPGTEALGAFKFSNMK
jgi:hypothetical protein